MVRILGFTLLMASLVFACRPTKKVQKIEEAISKKDTTTTVVITKVPDVDSLKVINGILGKVNQTRIDFKTFTAKLKVEYKSQEGSDQLTANIRMHKDSLIWMSLTGFLGVEGLRMLIDKDSVKLMNKQDKTIQYRSIDYLQELTDIPFDFITLQDMILGNPIFIDDNLVSYRNTGNQLLILIIGDFYKNLITLDNSDFKLLQNKLDDIDPVRNRTCYISYSGYESTAGFPFATKRNISVSEKGKLDINLEFKQYSFNQSLTYPFTVPKNYKIK